MHRGGGWGVIHLGAVLMSAEGGHVAVGPVDLQQVQMVRLQPPQLALHRRRDVARVHPRPLPLQRCSTRSARSASALAHAHATQLSSAAYGGVSNQTEQPPPNTQQLWVVSSPATPLHSVATYWRESTEAPPTAPPPCWRSPHSHAAAVAATALQPRVTYVMVGQ